MIGCHSQIGQVLQELLEIHTYFQHQTSGFGAILQKSKEAMVSGVISKGYMLGAPRCATYKSPQVGYFKSPKVDFPSFEGNDAHGWNSKSQPLLLI